MLKAWNNMVSKWTNELKKNHGNPEVQDNNSYMKINIKNLEIERVSKTEYLATIIYSDQDYRNQ